MNTRTLLIAVFGVLVFLMTACGTRLVDGEYRGEPLLAIEGSMVVRTEGATEAETAELERSLGALRVALFWSRHAVGPGDPAVSLVEQQVATDANFPVRYSIEVYRPPPEFMLTPAPEGGSGRYAVALVMVYLDSDGDGKWSPGTDRLIGGARDRAILYTPEGANSPFFGDLGPGYHRLITADPGQTCFARVHEHFHGDGEEDLDLYIDPERPTGSLVDVDCDGHHREWDICPPADALALPCRETNRLDPLVWQCDTCAVGSLADVCPAPAEVVSGCDAQNLDELVCAQCPRIVVDPELSCEDAEAQCRDTGGGPLCDARSALCREVLPNGADDCLTYTAQCFELGYLQGDCLGWLAECYQELTGDPAPAGPTCRSYGDICVEERTDEEACRSLYEVCVGTG
jgi:hypothetical protein